MAIEIRLLGSLEALVDGEPVEPGPPQQRTLLALLALHAGTAVRLAAIDGALWEEGPPPSATKVVQTYVSRLRKLLGADSIKLAPSGYTLDGYVVVDALRFRDLVERRELAQALALWRGSALSDVPALAADARQLDELRVSAIEDRVAAELDRGEGPALVPELETLVAEHPMRERLLGQLVLALYRSGRQADALAAYRSGREAFLELGFEPGPALRELELQILRHDPALSPAAHAASGPSARRPRRTRPALAVAATVATAAVAAIAIAATGSGHAKAVVPIRANTLLELDPRPTRLSPAFRSGATPPPSRPRPTRSGSRANASAPSPASISAPMLSRRSASRIPSPSSHTTTAGTSTCRAGTSRSSGRSIRGRCRSCGRSG